MVNINLIPGRQRIYKYFPTCSRIEITIQTLLVKVLNKHGCNKITLSTLTKGFITEQTLDVMHTPSSLGLQWF